MLRSSSWTFSLPSLKFEDQATREHASFLTVDALSLNLSDQDTLENMLRSSSWTFSSSLKFEDQAILRRTCCVHRGRSLPSLKFEDQATREHASFLTVDVLSSLIEI
ncbi:hypothetical protein AVEN_62734-1 [Araneus ventricosus]|uniref:Uncharacterized protein n=1 Tax=Araneus ventricosus TaxID=182803 RepID=A0A4Y2ILM7_ARAVE|nr:hypothetical protein AVEN_62734-1 [Araneus ventricosus]